MSNTQFNIEEFNNQSVEVMSTVMENMAEADYPASVEKVDVRQYEKGDDIYTFMDILWEIDAPDERERLGRKKLTARQSISLDLIPGTVKLDYSKGKNVLLGRLREALGQNQPNWSPSMLEGGNAMVHVKAEASGKTGDDRMFDRVTSVTRL